MGDGIDEQKTKPENDSTDSLIDNIADDLLQQTTPSVEVKEEETTEESTEKKTRKKRKKKVTEPIFDLEDASSMVAIPFAMWGKPLTSEENIRLSGVVSRWLDKRAESLGKYSVDIALAVCLLEVVLKRTDVLTRLITAPIADHNKTDTEMNNNAE